MSNSAMHARFGKVAVLTGGSSPERDVSLQSGAAVLAALTQSGVDAHCFDPAVTPLGELRAAGFDVAWNALHGGDGEDGTVQGALKTQRVPVTGSGVLGSALAMDKVRSKAVLAHAGIAVPAGIQLHRDEQPPADMSFPVFVKPANGGSSIGSMPVADAGALGGALSAAFEHDDVVIVESLLTGPEYTVAVLDQSALPVIQIDASNEFYDYHAKYVSEQTRFTCPALSDAPALAQQLQDTALASFKALDCHGWGRVDFMADAAGTPYVLEVNTVPGMTSHSLVPCAAAANGMPFNDLCVRILELALPVEDD